MSDPSVDPSASEIALDAAAKPLTPAAQRALAEAQARRSLAPATLPPEHDGRGGLEPVRYGDWEVKGLASDF